jgi:hypothetical protein
MRNADAAAFAQTDQESLQVLRIRVCSGSGDNRKETRRTAKVFPEKGAHGREKLVRKLKNFVNNLLLRQARYFTKDLFTLQISHSVKMNT